MKRYYAKDHHYASSTSHGFANDTFVMVFESKSQRDDWVGKSDSLGAESIRRDQVTREATNVNLSQGGDNAPQPFTGDYWAIDPFYADWDNGIIGRVVNSRYCMGMTDTERFYK